MDNTEDEYMSDVFEAGGRLVRLDHSTRQLRSEQAVRRGRRALRRCFPSKEQAKPTIRGFVKNMTPCCTLGGL